jgi:hypothetical protein
MVRNTTNTKTFVFSAALSTERIKAAAVGVDPVIVGQVEKFAKGAAPLTSEVLLFIIKRIPDSVRLLESELERYLQSNDSAGSRQAVLAAMHFELETKHPSFQTVGALTELYSRDLTKNNGVSSRLEDFSKSSIPALLASRTDLVIQIPTRLALLALIGGAHFSDSAKIQIYDGLIASQMPASSAVCSGSLEALALSRFPELATKNQNGSEAWQRLGQKFLDALIVNSALQSQENVSSNPTYSTWAAASANLANIIERLGFLGCSEAINVADSDHTGAMAAKIKARYLSHFASCRERAGTCGSDRRVRSGEISVITSFISGIYDRPSWADFGHQITRELIISELFMRLLPEQLAVMSQANLNISNAAESLRDGSVFEHALKSGACRNSAVSKLLKAQTAIGGSALTSVARCLETLASVLRSLSDRAPRTTGIRFVKLFRALGGTPEQLGKLAVAMLHYSRSNYTTLKAIYLASTQVQRQSILSAIRKAREQGDSSAPFKGQVFKKPWPTSMLIPRLWSWLFDRVYPT